MRVCGVSVSFRGTATVYCPMEDDETVNDIAELTDKEILTRMDISQVAEWLDEDCCEIEDIGNTIYDDGA